jgi:iron complex transport system ATP-binding protein
MLSIRNVSAGYGSQCVLHEVSLEVGRGQIVGVIGPNGCGKTTLLRVASGALPPMSGQVHVAGEDIRRTTGRRLAKVMACLLQDFSLDLPFIIRDVVLMGRWPYLHRLGWETHEDRRIAQQAMELADVSHLADRSIVQCSGGERQRTFSAMCLAQQPQVLLLDEPTTHLDIAHQLSLLDLIRALNRQTGMTVLAVFHDLNLASEYCDGLVLLKRGRVDIQGAPQAVLTAERIRRVYGINVVVVQNPVSSKPHIVVHAGTDHPQSDPTGPSRIVGEIGKKGIEHVRTQASQDRLHPA